MKRDPQKYYEWKRRSKPLARSAKRIRAKSESRGMQSAAYSIAHAGFLVLHPICPVTGEAATQIHHSAKREGRWLNLQRYWIAVSAAGHQYIEDHKTWAGEHDLMVRVRESASEHIAALQSEGVSLFDPVFYQNWDGQPILVN